MNNLISVEAALKLGHAGVLAVFVMGLLCFFIRPSSFRQIAGLKLMLQSVSLGLVLAGWEHQDLKLMQSMVVSTLVVEAIVIGLALTMIIRINKQQKLENTEDVPPPGEGGETGDG
jgi:NADH:ubiquinone oxidoreductase subunit K